MEGTRESHPSVHDLQSTTRLANVVFDYFSHSCPKMCKICLKRPLDATFLDCLALTFCGVIGELLPEWACLTLQGGTTFLLTSKLADIPVSRVRIIILYVPKRYFSDVNVGKLEESSHATLPFLRFCL